MTKPTKKEQPIIQSLIEANKELFWFIPEAKKKNISIDVLVEFVLNYGDYDSTKQLLDSLGGPRVAEIFFSHMQSERKAGNYFPEIRRYFTEYFNYHYAS